MGAGTTEPSTSHPSGTDLELAWQRVVLNRRHNPEVNVTGAVWNPGHSPRILHSSESWGISEKRSLINPVVEYVKTAEKKKFQQWILGKKFVLPTQNLWDFSGIIAGKESLCLPTVKPRSMHQLLGMLTAAENSRLCIWQLFEVFSVGIKVTNQLSRLQNCEESDSVYCSICSTVHSVQLSYCTEAPYF